jgi:anti-sigma regulatory factor (Ser/Thr protein kinase)
MTSNSGVATQSTGAHSEDPQLVLPGSSLDEVAEGRRFVRDGVADRLPPRTTQQMQLATSELVTNALMHGKPGPIELRLHVNDVVAWVRVASTTGATANVPPVDAWSISAAEATSGRGLGIVKAVSDRVEVERSGPQLAVTALFDFTRR